MPEQYPISTASRAAVETIIERAMTKCKENKQRALNNNQERETANAVSSKEILKREQSKIRDPKRDEWLQQYVQQYLQSEKHQTKWNEMLRASHERKYNKSI